MSAEIIQNITAATKANAEALQESSKAAFNGAQELAKAYQTLATKNAEKIQSFAKEIAAVKSPVEFKALHDKLIEEVTTSVFDDSKQIVELTTSVVETVFDPIKKQIEATFQPLQAPAEKAKAPAKAVKVAEVA